MKLKPLISAERGGVCYFVRGAGTFFVCISRDGEVASEGPCLRLVFYKIA